MPPPENRTHRRDAVREYRFYSDPGQSNAGFSSSVQEARSNAHRKGSLWQQVPRQWTDINPNVYQATGNPGLNSRTAVHADSQVRGHQEGAVQQPLTLTSLRQLAPPEDSMNRWMAERQQDGVFNQIGYVKKD